MLKSNRLTRWAGLACCLMMSLALSVMAQPPGPPPDEPPGPPPSEPRAQQPANAQAGQQADQQGGRRGGPRNFDPAQMFDRLDTNKDGQVSKQEFDDGMAQFRANRGPRNNAGGNPGFNPGDMRARFRQGMLDRIKEQLGATDQEWTVLSPRVEKVMELQQAQRPGFGFRGGDQSNAIPEAEALRKAIDDKGTSAEALQKKMEAYRTAKKKLTADLEAARGQLREVLTARQEAALVLEGILD